MRGKILQTYSTDQATLPLPREQNGVSGKPNQRTGSLRETRFVIIEGQRLWQECLSHSIGLLHPGVSLIGCKSVDYYIESDPSELKPDAIILCFTQTEMLESETLASIRRLVKAAEAVPVVVLSDCEDIDQMVAVLECGVNGYIPASVGLKAIVNAIKTAASGGFVLTGSGLEALSQAIVKEKPAEEPCNELLTSRQSAVAEALRQGKPNKMIAFELGMCENTVKVHVRNILKKLNVVNRTEAAFKLNQVHATQ